MNSSSEKKIIKIWNSHIYFRPNKDVCLYRVSLLSLFFLPTLAHFIVNLGQNVAKRNDFKNLSHRVLCKFKKKNKMILPTYPIFSTNETLNRHVFCFGISLRIYLNTKYKQYCLYVLNLQMKC